MADTTSKVQPYTFDLGHMMCNDSNPLPSHTPATLEATLSSTAQSCAQALINQLLTTCTIARSSDGDLQIQLPEPTTRLPREKPVPKEKEATRWEKFAAKKGIKAKRRDGKLVFDEERGEWKAKYGYKGKEQGMGDWLVEVDDKKDGEREDGRGAPKDGAARKRKGHTEDLAARKGKMAQRKSRLKTSYVGRRGITAVAASFAQAEPGGSSYPSTNHTAPGDKSPKPGPRQAKTMHHPDTTLG